jgi:hypothetical protein
MFEVGKVVKIFYKNNNSSNTFVATGKIIEVNSKFIMISDVREGNTIINLDYIINVKEVDTNEKI